LRLLALTDAQLALLFEDLERLQSALGVAISRDNLNAVVRRAIGLKLAKMAVVEPRLHPWYTYWLVVVKAANTGAGLVGFKGTPDQDGEVEIGYGIAPDYRNRGYMTEAVRVLIAWAFDEVSCQAVFADPRQDNIASQRVLAKAGMVLDEETPDVQLWRIDRASWHVGGGEDDGIDQTSEASRR
jgi:GNAT superfamily N-acetyltransferase